MQYTTTSQEIFETFCISKAHKKHLKIDENNKEYIKLDRDKSTFKSHRDFCSEKEITFKHL